MGDDVSRKIFASLVEQIRSKMTISSVKNYLVKFFLWNIFVFKLRDGEWAWGRKLTCRLLAVGDKC